MANMSYCAFENTLSDLRQLMGMMEEAETIADLDMSEHEARAFRQMAEMCESVQNEIERLEEAGEPEEDEEDE